jgi:hypothetical protein
MDSMLDSFWHSTDLNYFNVSNGLVYKNLWYVEKNYPFEVKQMIDDEQTYDEFMRRALGDQITQAINGTHKRLLSQLVTAFYDLENIKVSDGYKHKETAEMYSNLLLKDFLNVKLEEAQTEKLFEKAKQLQEEIQILNDKIVFYQNQYPERLI